MAINPRINEANKPESALKDFTGAAMFSLPNAGFGRGFHGIRENPLEFRFPAYKRPTKKQTAVSHIFLNFCLHIVSSRDFDNAKKENLYPLSCKTPWEHNSSYLYPLKCRKTSIPLNFTIKIFHHISSPHTVSLQREHLQGPRGLFQLSHWSNTLDDQWFTIARTLCIHGR